MRITRFFTTSVLAAGLTFGCVMAASAETLTDAMISAYKNSGLLEQNRALLRAADEDVAQAVSTLRPVINYVVGSNYSTAADQVPFGTPTTNSLGLSADMLIYDFGRSALSIDLAKENVLALREALVGIEQDVLFRAVSAYMLVRRDAEIVGLRESNVNLITQELRATQDRFEVGEITRTDVAIAEARLASARSTLAVAVGNHAISREEYKVAVGQYPGVLAPPPPPPARASSQASANATARVQHPDILRAKRNVTVAELASAIATSSLRPSIRGSASFSVDLDGNDNSAIGLSMAGPIYQGGFLASNIRRSVAQIDSARAGLKLTGLAVAQNVGNAWARLVVADEALISSIEQIRAATAAFEGTREEAKLGARTTLDVLNEQQELLDASSNKVEAETQQYLAIYGLLGTTGLLTVDHLGLGIATYDPAAYYNAVKTAPTYGVSAQGDKLDSVLKALGKN